MSSLHKTTPKDLERFWDMVYIQVSDIENKFSQLVELEDNNWEQKQEEKKQLKVDIQLYIYVSVLVRPFCGGVAPPIILSSPGSKFQFCTTILNYHKTT